MTKEEREDKTVRNYELKLMYGKKEKKKLKEKAEALGLKPAQYVRLVSLNANIKVDKK